MNMLLKKRKNKSEAILNCNVNAKRKKLANHKKTWMTNRQTELQIQLLS